MARNLATFVALSLAFSATGVPAGIPSDARISHLISSARENPVVLETLRSRDRAILENVARGLSERYPSVVAGSEMVFSRQDRDGTVFYRLDFSGLRSPAHARALCEVLSIEPCIAKASGGRVMVLDAAIGEVEGAVVIEARMSEDIPFVFEGPQPARVPNPEARQIEEKVRDILAPLGAFPEKRPDLAPSTGAEASLEIPEAKPRADAEERKKGSKIGMERSPRPQPRPERPDATGETRIEKPSGTEPQAPGSGPAEEIKPVEKDKVDRAERDRPEIVPVGPAARPEVADGKGAASITKETEAKSRVEETAPGAGLPQKRAAGGRAVPTSDIPPASVPKDIFDAVPVPRLPAGPAGAAPDAQSRAPATENFGAGRPVRYVGGLDAPRKTGFFELADAGPSLAVAPRGAGRDAGLVKIPGLGRISPLDVRGLTSPVALVSGERVRTEFDATALFGDELEPDSLSQIAMISENEMKQSEVPVPEFGPEPRDIAFLDLDVEDGQEDIRAGVKESAAFPLPEPRDIALEALSAEQGADAASPPRDIARLDETHLPAARSLAFGELLPETPPDVMVSLADMKVPEDEAIAPTLPAMLTGPQVMRANLPVGMARLNGVFAAWGQDGSEDTLPAGEKLLASVPGDLKKQGVKIRDAKPVHAARLARVVFDDQYARPVTIPIGFEARSGRLQKLPVSRDSLLGSTVFPESGLTLDHQAVLSTKTPDSGFIEVAQVPTRPRLPGAPEKGDATTEPKPEQGATDRLDELLKARVPAVQSEQEVPDEAPFVFESKAAHEQDLSVSVFGEPEKSEDLPAPAPRPGLKVNDAGAGAETKVTEPVSATPDEQKRKALSVLGRIVQMADREQQSRATGAVDKASPAAATSSDAPAPVAKPRVPSRTAAEPEVQVPVRKQAPAAPRIERRVSADEMLREAQGNSAVRAAEEMALRERAKSGLARTRMQAATEMERVTSWPPQKPVDPADLRIELSYVGSKAAVAARVEELRKFFPPMILGKGRFFGASVPGYADRYAVGIAAYDIKSRDDIIWYAEKMGIPYALR